MDQIKHPIILSSPVLKELGGMRGGIDSDIAIP